jgi:hypothetical protein
VLRPNLEKSKAQLIFSKLAKVHYNSKISDDLFNKKVKKGRAQRLLKEKFDLQGRIADDANITGGVYKDTTNSL